MISEEKLNVIRNIDNRVRELELLDLVQIGSYNVNLSVFSYNKLGRINIVEDMGNIMTIELCDVSGKVFDKRQVSRKQIIRSIIDYEFSHEDLLLYDSYISYQMSKSLEEIKKSIDTIDRLNKTKAGYRKELFAVNDKARNYEQIISYDYCLVGSESLYSIIKKTKEGIRSEYIRKGMNDASINDNIEVLERGLFGKALHKKKIRKLKQEKREATAISKDNIELKTIALNDSIDKYMEDLKGRFIRVLRNMHIIGIARVSYLELVKGIKDEKLSDIMSDSTITPEIICEYFVNNLLPEDLIEPENAYNLFLEYVLGHLYNKKKALESGIRRIYNEIQDELDKQSGIVLEFVPQAIFNIEDEESYSKLHK